MNLSETAFITNTSEPNTYGLRWFTPTVEIDLCGHATLAAYTIVRKVKGDATATFNSQVSGDLITSVTDSGLMQLSFPANAYEAVAESAVEVEQVKKALPADLEIIEIAKGGPDIVVEVKLAPGTSLADIKPDHGLIVSVK
jgi:PhzF family phenazine biosynthesis protein